MTARPRLAALLLAAALGVPALPAPEGESPALPAPAPAAERWRFNPRERTARGLDAWSEGRFADADAAFTRALALAPGAGDPQAVDPLALLNAGTGRLAAGAPDEAAGLLAAAAERAAAAGGGELEIAARYNLGNARYAGGDFAAAVEAYRTVLRRQPDNAPAKHNLELALRRLAEQRQPAGGGGAGEGRPDEAGGKGDQGGGDASEPEPPAGDPEAAGGEPPIPPEDAAEDPAAAPQPAPGERPGGGGERRERPLPGFADQPDMTAEQAAAILEAVENLERQRRRARSAAAARRTTGGRDW